MRRRLGIELDRDQDGLPDPRRALAREACEELGLVIAATDIRTVGMATFDWQDEVGMTALLTTCEVTATAVEVAKLSATADVIEGRWEHEDDMLAVPVPKTLADVETLLAWTLTAEDHMPHLVAALVAVCHQWLVEEYGDKPERVLAYLQRLADRPPTPPPQGARHLRRGGS